MFHHEDSIIDVGGIKVGGQEPIVIIGGPCSVEGREMMEEIAVDVKNAGGSMLRGGAYKPRTSPYAFQGMGYDGIMCMVNARSKTGLPIVSELMSADKIEEFEEHVDLVQIGARNMQNFECDSYSERKNSPSGDHRSIPRNRRLETCRIYVSCRNRSRRRRSYHRSTQ